MRVETLNPVRQDDTTDRSEPFRGWHEKCNADHHMRIASPDHCPPMPKSGERGTVLLRAEGLKKAFGGQVVLDGVNLELRRGEVVLLRGENGSGKTTLLNILTGNLEPDAGAIHYLADSTPRSYRFPRRWWQELNPFDHFVPEFVAREGVGRTWQDVRLFGSQTLRDNITVADPQQPGENPLAALIAPWRGARREQALRQGADARLAGFGLAGREGSSADKISLGQSKRVAVARTVAAGARVLFLDEPLAGLDRQGIHDILTLLRALAREHDLTLVIVEHAFNHHHLDHLITTDWLLESGRIRNSPANNRRTRYGRPSSGTTSGGGRPAWIDTLAADSEVIDEPLPRGAILTRIRWPTSFDPNASPVLEIKDLIVNRGPRTVIGLDDQGHPAGLNLTLQPGEIAVLQAPNGWGKSTLFAAITGLLPAHAGTIRLDGQPLDHLPPWQRVEKGLRALPSQVKLFPTLTAAEALGLARIKDNPPDLTRFAARPCASLSGGEKQRLGLAATPAATVNLFDEPLSALDNAEPFLRQFAIGKTLSNALLVFLPKTKMVKGNNP